MDWKDEYKRKLRSIEEAVSYIKSNDDIVVAMCASEPQGLMGAFHTRAGSVQDVKVFSCLTLLPYDFYMKPEMKGIFELNSWFHTANIREVIKKGYGTVTFVPNMLHRAATDRLYVKRPDIYMGTCTPPDRHGNVALGMSLTYEKDILENAKLVILEVNENMPRAFGDTLVNVRDVDIFVENNQKVPEMPGMQPSEVDMLIGSHIAELVEDGSTIQLGIGGIPNAAALSLKDKHDLGVHTEMFVDSMMDLYDMGVITNRKKGFMKDRAVTTFCMGSKKLYDWVDNNPVVEFHRGRWVNDPCVVRQNTKMVSINTCLSVDLTGQVASESIGPIQYSGTGGQTDTAVGAVEGLDGAGKSIIACYSTAKGGTISTITPLLTEGSAVTLHRSNVDYVVTENGIAALRGKSVRERAKALIAIAHPDHRKALEEKARALNIL
ncbi:MAG TPA: acetyl-CoA hydrolase/transferase C-terminal domain-containing protein [Bacillota bacterium]|nr:acetyl-CoA hydrolase/transferase C-terminal domain-containing protein [Bacillota bacterium]HOG52896.1 acetyl-CoA hydrolase/transferase C-terminal domain-containing protein [Bacillota bacterium]